MKLATIEVYLAEAKADYAKRGLHSATDNRKADGWWRTHRNKIERALITTDGADEFRARGEANRLMRTTGLGPGTR